MNEKTSSKSRQIGYWIATILFAIGMVVGGILELIYVDAMAETMEKLGYPAYVATLLGVAKLLGAAALLAPKLPLLKEWAYAGFAFELIGALVSHLAIGDMAGAGQPVMFFAVGAVSYFLRPASRRLPQSP